MSVQGTSVAAGIASTVQNAQQVARQRDQQEAEHSTDGRIMRDLFDSHLQGFEDSAREESAAHMHVDAELPQHQSQDQGKHRQPRPGDPPDPTDSAQTPPDAEAPAPGPRPEPDAPLYRHLDVQA
jgi:hypothetical protein